MTVVSVSELKANLSRYLREVRRGGEVQILDRGTPVARLVAAAPAAGGDEEQRRRLVTQGIVRPGNGGTAEVLAEPPLNLPASIAAALDEDRTDRL